MKNIPKPSYKKTDTHPLVTFPGRDPLVTWKARDANIYEKVLKVGQGTYGKVYKAKIKNKNNSKDDKVEFVALKKIILEQEKEGFPVTAIREIMILRKLKNKNISNLIEVVVSSPSEKNNKRGNVFLVFEYMEQDLYALLHSNNLKLSIPQVKQIFYQILNGLLYLKQNNIIHRDLKTSNILINNNGIVKLADFGLARIHNPKIKNPYTNKVVTLWYRAPEILLGGPYNIASDMWSAGIILAELLTNNCPFRAEIEIEQLQRIYDLCGIPDEKTWPEVTQMKNYKMFMPEKIPQNRLKEEIQKINHLDKYGVDLLVKMLELNPNNRLTVEEALNHPYFSNEPLMCKEEELPKVKEEVMELAPRLDKNGEMYPIKNVEISSKIYSNNDKTKMISYDNNNKDFNKNQSYLNKKRLLKEDN